MLAANPASPSKTAIRPTGSLKERAYIYLKQSILSSQLSPGQPLAVKELAEEMGISRTPVREALVTLHSEGLVEVFPSRGTFVARITVADLRELSELRESLEGMTARLAAQRRTAADMEDLDSLLDAAGEFRAGEGGRMVEVGTASSLFPARSITRHFIGGADVYPS